MKKKSTKYLITAVALTAVLAGMMALSLTAHASYTPKNNVSEMNYQRSQVFLDGKGYQLDEYREKEAKEEAVKRQKKTQADEVEDEDEDENENNSLSRAPRIKPESYTPQSSTPKYKARKFKPRSYTASKSSKKGSSKKSKKTSSSKKKPTISTSLKDGKKIKDKTVKFTVKAKDGSGKSITAKKITVKFNGKKLSEVSPHTYIGNIVNGDNKVTITAVAKNGKKKTIKRTLKGALEPEKVGSLTAVITADALGIKTVVKSKTVDILEKEKLSDAVDRYIKASDLSGITKGGSCGISGVKKHGIINDIDLSDEELEKLEEEGIDLPGNKDVLKNGDFGDGSEWRIKVNGSDVSQSISKIDANGNMSIEIYYVVPVLS